jgi:hypothetical protein
LIRILSLGAGVQSSTIALMSAAGELPALDGAIFADTQGEPEEVYRWLDWLEAQLPFPVYRVTAGDLRAHSLVLRRSQKSGRVYMKGIIPAFVKNPDGSKGLLGRRCTRDYKIAPIERKLRQLLDGQHRRLGPCRTCGHSRRDHRENRVEKREFCKGTLDGALIETVCRCASYNPQPIVQQWIGISRDEADRMKPGRVKWAEYRWPLIDAGMSRADCLAWMASKGYPAPPRSACEFCPFHGDAEWLRLRTENPAAFGRVVRFEQELQAAALSDEVMRGVPFLHESLRPISEVPFDELAIQARAQLNLFSNECEGMCGV